MSFTTLEGQRIQEYLPEVMSWCAKAINEREEAINWAWDEREPTGKGEVPAPWLMIDGETYKTNPEPDDFAPSADLWDWIQYGGYFLQQARARIAHMIGASSHGTSLDMFHPKQVGGPAGTIQAGFDPEENAYYMTGDWVPWSSMDFPSGPAIGISNQWGSNIRAFLQGIGYPEGRWISEAFPVTGGNWYVDTPIHDPRKWYQLREAIQALRWFRILSVPFLDGTQSGLKITQNADPDFSPHDIRGDYTRYVPGVYDHGPLFKISPNELYTKWEEAWNAMALDDAHEFAPLAGSIVLARGAPNLDTADQYDWLGYFRAEASAKYTIKIGYLEEFKGAVVGDWIFSWDIARDYEADLTDSFGNTYESAGRVVHHNAGSSLALGAENHAELNAEIPGYPLEIPEDTEMTEQIHNFVGVPHKINGFTSRGQIDEDNWMRLGTLSLKCEGSFTYT